jgi:hypothetical protein
MNKIKVSEATNIQLDWLVAKCEGATDLRIHICGEHSFWVYTTPKDDDFPESMQYLSNVDYSTDWSLGGQIVDKEDIALGHGNSQNDADTRFSASKLGVHPWAVSAEGPTKLIAAMRCYVVSKLGETVEIPKEI